MNILLFPFVEATKAVSNAIDYIRHDDTNPYLQGNYAPVKSEVTEHNCHVIDGQVPEEIDGVVIRNGPNPKFMPKGLYHWFDGDGMVHTMLLREGKAHYSNHQLRTKKLLQDVEQGGPQLIGIGDLVGRYGLMKIGLFGLRAALDRNLDVSMMLQGEGTANTSIVFHHNTLLALVESSMPMKLEISKDDGQIRSVGAVNFDGRLTHPFTAHPKICPFTGEMLFFGYRIERKPYITYSIVSKEGHLISSIDVGIKRAIMMHDFAITKSFACFFDLPLLFKPQNLLFGGQAFVFDKSSQSRIGLVPRYAKSSKEVKWFSIAPCAVYHYGNAYETVDSGETIVVIQACRYAYSDLSNLLGDPSQLYEWHLNVQTGTVEERVLSNISSEFPSINPNYALRKHRYAYISTSCDPPRATIAFDGVAKIDTWEAKLVKRHNYGENVFGGELSFIPSAGSSKEEAGYLAGFVHDEGNNQSEFRILSAETLEMLCRIAITNRVPYGFHSIWLPSSNIPNVTLRSKL